jgi:TRAP-type C4-dicarboxylate transport system substrate-binding protein
MGKQNIWRCQMKRSILVVTVMVTAIFICQLLVSLPVGAQSKEKPIELSYSSHFPANYGAEIASMKWAEEVEKRTNGRVKITFYHSGTLTTPANIYEGVVKGISDIGQSVFSYTRGRFPMMEVCDLPGYPMNAIIPSLVAQDVFNKFKPKELNDVHVLYLHAHMPGVYFMAKKEVRKLEDMKGMRIRAAGLAARMVELLRGTPVSMPKGDQYDALQKGVVDGTVGAPNELKGWKVAEVAKSSTWVQRAGYLNTMFIVMNKRKWNSLPPDIQKVFTDVSKDWTENTGKAWNAIEVEGVKYGKELKHIIINVGPEEQTRWVKALQPMFDEWVKNAETKGLPGKKALEYRQELIEKYSKMYPPVKYE